MLDKSFKNLNRPMTYCQMFKKEKNMMKQVNYKLF